jgi:hypothetical protein
MVYGLRMAFEEPARNGDVTPAAHHFENLRRYSA